MSGTNVLYPAESLDAQRRAVHSTLFQSMRWTYWYEIADRLRYVGITASGINQALTELEHADAVERMTAGDGRLIWRIRL